jgi:hypothetical protein
MPKRMADDDPRVTRGPSHLDAKGRARMVDVADKEVTAREAVAEAVVHMAPATLAMVVDGQARRVTCSPPPASRASRRPSGRPT